MVVVRETAHGTSATRQTHVSSRIELTTLSMKTFWSMTWAAGNKMKWRGKIMWRKRFRHNQHSAISYFTQCLAFHCRAWFRSFNFRSSKPQTMPTQKRFCAMFCEMVNIISGWIFFSLRHFGHCLLSHFGHLSHSCTKLAITVLISLHFQTFWPKWLNFFLSFQKRFGLWPKNPKFRQLSTVSQFCVSNKSGWQTIYTFNREYVTKLQKRSAWNWRWLLLIYSICLLSVQHKSRAAMYYRF